MKKLSQKLATAAAACLLMGSAFADIGTASVNDVTLAGKVADAFAYQAGWNPQSGPNGDTSGFGTTFNAFGSSSTWDLLGKKDGSPPFSTTGPLAFTLTGSGSSGTWTVTNTGAAAMQLDLVFALHAGNQGGAWLFDNQNIAAGQTLDGTWRMNWTVGNNGSNPDFSNATIFGRDAATTPVPEPATFGMLLAGLGLVGAIARRRRDV